MKESDFKSIQVSRANYILLMRKRHGLFKSLEEKGVVRNVSFDDVITELLLDNGELKID